MDDSALHSIDVTATPKPVIDISCLSTLIEVPYNNVKYYRQHPSVINKDVSVYYYKLRRRQKDLAVSAGMFEENDIIDPDPYERDSYYIFRIIPKPPGPRPTHRPAIGAIV